MYRRYVDRMIEVTHLRRIRIRFISLDVLVNVSTPVENRRNTQCQLFSSLQCNHFLSIHMCMHLKSWDCSATGLSYQCLCCTQTCPYVCILHTDVSGNYYFMQRAVVLGMDADLCTGGGASSTGFSGSTGTLSTSRLAFRLSSLRCPFKRGLASTGTSVSSSSDLSLSQFIFSVLSRMEMKLLISLFSLFGKNTIRDHN